MAYQPLALDPSTPPSVKKLIDRLEGLSFNDIHTMLRLPVRDYRLDAGCNFAIAQILMTAIGGISTTLYRQGKTDSERFRWLLRDHYQWQLEPTHDVAPDEAARIVYQVFRNPLIHDLGLDLHGRSTGIKVKVKRLQRSQGGLTERWIENLERGPTRPRMSSVVTVQSDTKVLLVEALYWGLRRMVEAMTRDAQLMSHADTFLSSKI